MIHDEIPGWMTGQEIFEEAIDKYDNCFFIEIGSFYGKSAIYMAELIKNKGKNIKILCVDPYIYGMYGEHRPLQQDWTVALNSFIKNIYDNGFRDILFPIISPSEVALQMLQKLLDIPSVQMTELEPVKSMPIRMIYIDGNHAAAWVKKDIENSLYLIEEGILCGHDYAGGEWQEVIDTVDKMLGKPAKVIGGDTWVHYIHNGVVK